MARSPGIAGDRSASASCWSASDRLRSSVLHPDSTCTGSTIAARIAAVDWTSTATALDAQGWSLLPDLLTGAECDTVAGLYANETGFRSRVIMARHGFGQGEYRYFAYPLPPLVQKLRQSLYAQLAPLANKWRNALGVAVPFPRSFEEYILRCHEAGQVRPTPLILRYGPGDYNCLHQDLYGQHNFPLQAAFLLSEPGTDFTGGELVLTEQRPRMQSRVHVVPLEAGEGVIFAVNHRPVHGTRGTYRVAMRHGVSPLREGRRHTLGIILHDAA